MNNRLEISYPCGKTNHIMVFDNILDAATCADLIGESKLFYRKLFRQGPTLGGVNDLIKNSMDFEYGRHVCNIENVPYSKFELFEKKVIDSLYCAINHYIEQYPQLWDCPGINDTGLRLQHYRRNFGFYRTHQDGGAWHDGLVSRRILGVIIYLNDVEIGGETLFPEHDIKVQAKTGRIVVFPAHWTHPHGGAIPLSDDKWIISTFIMFTKNININNDVESISIEASSKTPKTVLKGKSK